MWDQKAQSYDDRGLVGEKLWHRIQAAITAAQAAEHHLAQTKLEWARAAQRAPSLAEQLELDVLPALSTANVRELLRSVLPLRQP